MIFVDTSFWVALRRHRDERHHEAVALTRAHAGALVTSNHVLGETWTVLRRREGHAQAVETLDAVTRSRRVAIERIGPETERDAWRRLRDRDDREFSFVDATSFAYMAERGLQDVLTFDGDFAAAGFRELRA
ncbi:MAG: PIN domain-containing protein [Solirubrobacteraceae bacterium]